MREIKFRAWVVDIPGRITYSMGNHMEYDVVIVNGKYASVESGWDIMGTYDYHLMQYTGLKDKNGKEIYEGDILLNTTIKPQKLEVYFDEKSIGTMGGSFDVRKLPNDKEMTWRWEIDKIEIIGNIYENPELLK